MHCFFRALCHTIALVAVTGCIEPPFDYDLYENAPSVQVQIAYQPGSEGQLKLMLSSFATANGYQIRVARVHPENLDFSILLWRPDSMIAGGTPFKLDDYHFGIYPSKADPLSSSSGRDLLAALETELISR